MGVTKCDVIPGIFSTRHNVSAVLASITVHYLRTVNIK